jgi:hypothetical protein
VVGKCELAKSDTSFKALITHSGNCWPVIDAVNALISTSPKPSPLLLMPKRVLRNVGECCINLLQLESHFSVEYSIFNCTLLATTNPTTTLHYSINLYAHECHAIHQHPPTTSLAAASCPMRALTMLSSCAPNEFFLSFLFL